jgi:hypothetical protein
METIRSIIQTELLSYSSIDLGRVHVYHDMQHATILEIYAKLCREAGWRALEMYPQQNQRSYLEQNRILKTILRTFH